MSDRSLMWTEIAQSKKKNPRDTRLDKKGIARLIFEYADTKDKDKDKK